MKFKIATLLLVFFVVLSGNAQDNDDGNFLVTFDKFTPPIRDMVSHFEGQPAENFLASDINGNEHFLGNYKGKRVILWFWSIEDTKAQGQVGPMELLLERNPTIELISFVSESKEVVTDYAKKSNIKFPIIPNGDIFGQMAYGADLGKPRMFIIDRNGIIKTVLPEQAFIDNSRLLIGLESIMKGMN